MEVSLIITKKVRSSMRMYSYFQPLSKEDLFDQLELLDQNQVKFLAGGTDLVPRMNMEFNAVPTGNETPITIVYLGKLGLDQIKDFGDVVSIGAMCTLNYVMDHKTIREKLPVLSQTIHEMAGLTIRNTGTLGGNIMNASPAADSVPTLLALEADFVLLSKNGERIVPATEFFLSPGRTAIADGEILSEIRIHVGPGKASFQKLGRRQAESLSVVNAAAYVELAGEKCYRVRVAIGSCAPTTRRCLLIEKDLDNKVLTVELIKEVCANVIHEICPIDDVRSSAWYRNKVAPVMVARALIEAAGLTEGGTQ